MNYKKLRNYLKNFWNKYVLITGGGLLIVFGIIDYFKNWEISSFLQASFKFICRDIENIVFIIIVIWLIVLTSVFFKKIKSNKIIEKPNQPDKLSDLFKKDLSSVKTDISDIKKEIESIKSWNNEIRNLKRWKLKQEIKEYEDKNQRGEIISRVDLLKIDIDQAWEWRIHETIEDILSFLRRKRIDSESSAKLEKQLNRLGPEYDEIKKQIKKEIKL